jgi:predicted membrane channel-forming protein YqfA (hemolysin III family)
MKQNIFIDLIRSFFFMIDKAVYALIEGVYNVFHEIAGTGILGEDAFLNFTTRIYLLLGIFALFKIAFSLIGMFMNPDSFSDPKSGGGKLVGRVVKALLLIVFVPTIFQLGYRLQGIVIDNNILPTIILGASTNPEKTKTTFSSAGRNMATTVFKAFFKPYPSYIKEDGTMDFKGCTDCAIYLDENAAVSQFDPILNETLNKNYIFDYNVLISLIAGGAVAFLLFTFAFDIAVRSVKLAFMQLIAPIPIIMSIDPKKGEEGLKKWVSTTTSTYLDLFMRLVLIYFIVYILAEITKSGGAFFTLFKYDASGNPVAADVGLFAGVFIIIGLLLFATQAPNLIYDLLGIKPPSGGFGLNPLKKLAPLAPFNKAASVLGGAFLGAAGGSALRAKAVADKAKAKNDPSIRKNMLKEATFGFFGGGYSGMKQGFKSDGKQAFYKAGLGAAGEQYGRYSKTDGTKIAGRADAFIKQKIGQKTKFDEFEAQGKDLDNLGELVKDLDSIAATDQRVKAIIDKIQIAKTNPSAITSSDATVIKLKADIETIKNSNGGNITQLEASQIATLSQQLNVVEDQIIASTLEKFNDDLVKTRGVVLDDILKQDGNQVDSSGNTIDKHDYHDSIVNIKRDIGNIIVRNREEGSFEGVTKEREDKNKMFEEVISDTTRVQTSASVNKSSMTRSIDYRTAKKEHELSAQDSKESGKK